MILNSEKQKKEPFFLLRKTGDNSHPRRKLSVKVSQYIKSAEVPLFAAPAVLPRCVLRNIPQCDRQVMRVFPLVSTPQINLGFLNLFMPTETNGLLSREFQTQRIFAFSLPLRAKDIYCHSRIDKCAGDTVPQA